MNNMARLKEWAEQNPTARLYDIAYNATARRMHHELRRAFVISSGKRLADALGTATSAKDCFSTSGQVRRNAAFVFPGQGIFRHDMESRFHQDSEHFRRTVNKYNKLIAQLGYRSTLPFEASTNRPSESLVQNHLKLVFIEIALADF